MKKVVIICLLVVAGCISKGVDLRTPFNPNEVSYVLGPGEGVIKGSAFLAIEGRIHKAIGQQVLLVPFVSGMFQDRPSC